MAETKLHKRGLTSFFTLFGFIIMSVTGLVLYVVPAGRIAYWTNWELLAMSKTDWGNIHILSSVLFILAGVFHTYFNWKPLINYFKDRARKGVKLRRELAISSVLSLVIVIGSIWPFPPLSYLLDFNEWVKTTWVVEDDYEPPIGHAEMLSLKTFAQKMDIDLSQAVQELHVKGIEFDSPEQTLDEIGLANEVAPMNLYLMIKKFEPVPTPEELSRYTAESIEVEFAGTSIGNKTIASVCERLGLAETTAKERLAKAGLADDLTRIMKTVSTEAGTEPIEIMKLLLLEDFQLGQ